MYIVEMSTGNNIDVTVEEVTAPDFKMVKQSKRFKFNWDKLKQLIVYKLIPIGTNEIAGLMALIDHPAHSEEGAGFTEVKLIESAIENVGKDKKYERVAGSLLAFACREAFRKGYDGTIFLIPKTGLVAHYISRYGFQSTGKGLCLDMMPSYVLTQEFL